jgi:L-asparaginase
LRDILIISTGGTFNKVYNRFSGELEIDGQNSALKTLEQSWLTKLNYKSIINKDSLDFTDRDREILANFIKNSNFSKIVVIHGTDTIDLSADRVAKLNLNKSIIFTGAMVPFSIDPIEATANLAQALGFIKLSQNGVYISLNGVVERYNLIYKDRSQGKFKLK